MKQIIHLTNIEITPMTELEMQVVEGGEGLWPWIGQQVISHWDEIKRGFIAGWKALK
jgi:hypothetical protein